MRKFYRSRENKMLAGILGGMAELLSVDVSLLRVGAVFVGFFTGGLPFLFAYLVGWAIIPLAPPKEEQGEES
ncbi:MAG: PspC domain-containing protein [Dehalococcoidia bacterium]